MIGNCFYARGDENLGADFKMSSRRPSGQETGVNLKRRKMRSKVT